MRTKIELFLQKIELFSEKVSKIGVKQGFYPILWDIHGTYVRWHLDLELDKNWQKIANL